jgi:hypothetical protein
VPSVRAPEPEDPSAAAEAVGADASTPSGWFPGWVKIVSILSAVYGTLRIVEWCVLALTRDYQDQLSRSLSLLTGVPPDDPETRPRVRLNFRWLKKRVRRWFRGFILISLGAATFSIVRVLPYVGKPLFTALVTAWTIYWLAVFALAKTQLAWDPADDDTLPWFLRLDRPGLRWWLPRLWARLMTRFSRSVWPACASFQRAPYEAIGLALARVVLYVPVLYTILRPVYVVAAQHVMLARPSSAVLRRAS